MKTENRKTGYGTVTEVFIKDDKRRVYVSVEIGPSNVHKPIPFYTGEKGVWKPPREGDEVEVYQTGKNSYAARKAKMPPGPRRKGWHEENGDKISRPDDLIEDDVCLRFEDGSEFFFRRELEGDEEVRSLHIRMSGDVTIEAGGEIKKKPGADTDADPDYFPEDRERTDFD